MQVIIDGVEYRPYQQKIESEYLFKDFIKLKREAIGYTLNAAAKNIGCSKSYIWEIENKESPQISFAMIVKISDAYGLDIASMAMYFRNE